jgi:hypothetical protein
MLAGDFTLLHTLKLIFKNISPPSYETFTDLDEMSRNLKKIEYIMDNVWKKMCRYLKVQIPRQSQIGSEKWYTPNTSLIDFVVNNFYISENPFCLNK